MAGMKLTNRNRNKITIKNRIIRAWVLILNPTLIPIPSLVWRNYRVSFIPSGISGGGALIRLWLLP